MQTGVGLVLLGGTFTLSVAAAEQPPGSKLTPVLLIGAALSFALGLILIFMNRKRDEKSAAIRITNCEGVEVVGNKASGGPLLYAENVKDLRTSDNEVDFERKARSKSGRGRRHFSVPEMPWKKKERERKEQEEQKKPDESS